MVRVKNNEWRCTYGEVLRLKDYTGREWLAWDFPRICWDICMRYLIMGKIIIGIEMQEFANAGTWSNKYIAGGNWWVGQYLWRKMDNSRFGLIWILEREERWFIESFNYWIESNHWEDNAQICYLYHLLMPSRSTILTSKQFWRLLVSCHWIGIYCYIF